MLAWLVCQNQPAIYHKKLPGAVPSQMNCPRLKRPTLGVYEPEYWVCSAGACRTVRVIPFFWILIGVGGKPLSYWWIKQKISQVVVVGGNSKIIIIPTPAMLPGVWQMAVLISYVAPLLGWGGLIMSDSQPYRQYSIVVIAMVTGQVSWLGFTSAG